MLRSHGRSHKRRNALLLRPPFATTRYLRPPSPLPKPRIPLQRLLLRAIRGRQDPSRNRTSRRPPLSPRGAKPFLQERLLQFQRGGAEAEGPSQRSQGRSRCSHGRLGLLCIAARSDLYPKVFAFASTMIALTRLVGPPLISWSRFSMLLSLFKCLNWSLFIR